MRAFHVTYDTVTPESAKHGDSDDRGFVTADDIEVSTVDSPVGPAFEPIKAAYDNVTRSSYNRLARLLNVR